MPRRQAFHCYDPTRNADKVYELTMMPAGGGTFDVVGRFGKRGGKLPGFHVHVENVPFEVAEEAYLTATRTRLKHNYQTAPLSILGGK